MTQNQLTAKYGVHSTQLHNWKKQAFDGLMSSFAEKRERQTQDQSELIEELYKQIDQLSFYR